MVRNTKMLRPAPGKVVLLLEAIQFYCEASYDGRGRERGDSYTECIRISD